jgi:pimeloyl-ACP methyl ester carboxylesterase
LLKLQEFTDPTPYNIPSLTSLSRFLYTSTSYNGTLVPASAYVLWPYTPKQFSANKSTTWRRNAANATKAKAPVVLWTHGTSGFYADGAPSAHRSLFYGDIVPFALAQAGYAVVATDYAGLGVDRSWDGSFVPHQYLAADAAAADGLNALRAARTAFDDKITDEYVVVGHSQGGAAAWAVPQLLAERAENYPDVQAGYLGTVVFNPASGTIADAGPQIFLPWAGKVLEYIFPTFNLSEWLSPLGVARTKLLDQIQGGQMVSVELFRNPAEILNPAWNDTWEVHAVEKILQPGNRAYRGPMILYQGTADRPGAYEANKALWNATCREYPGNFELVEVTGANHFPTIEATRAQWLRWIEDRFERRPLVSRGCANSVLESFLPLRQYQPAVKSFIQWTGQPWWFYETPAGS